MKIFLVTAGLLMTGASVYGIVDYNKKAESKAFKELYKEAPARLEADVKEEPSVPVAEKNIVMEKGKDAKADKLPVKKTEKKTVRKNKKERVFRLKEFSRGKLE